MTHQEDDKSFEQVTDLLTRNGWRALPELIRVLVNQAMAGKRLHHLQSEAYERTVDRRGHANGCKPNTYEKVRQASQVRDAAVLLAPGITPAGERRV